MTTRYFKATLPIGPVVRSSMTRSYVAAFANQYGTVSWTQALHHIPSGATWGKAEEITGKEYRTILAAERGT